MTDKQFTSLASVLWLIASLNATGWEAVTYAAMFCLFGLGSLVHMIQEVRAK